MEVSIIGFTQSHMTDLYIEATEGNIEEIKTELKALSGAEAGICYMKDKYYGSYVSDKEKALKRFDTVIGTGHHSIAGHAQINMLLEGIPKILAIYLNNLRVYETSEKSGRYTEMSGCSEKEMYLYNKWKDLLEGVFAETYSGLDNGTVNKLAMENARYMLSVFTPTTMGYTTSIRQWNYIIDWLDRFVKRYESNEGYFFKEMCKYCLELHMKLKELLYVDGLRDFKNREGLDTICFNGECNEEQFGKMYTLNYKGSFVEFAQAQRHRTLQYTMYFSGVSNEYYVPKELYSIKYNGRTMADEWLEDIKSVGDLVPQGTIVSIEESGYIGDFFLKMRERNCGRAQFEIEQSTLNNANKLYLNYNKGSQQYNKSICDLFKENYINGRPKMKGELLYCKEKCFWGCKGSIDKRI